MTVLATDLAPGRGALEVAKATAAAINSGVAGVAENISDLADVYVAQETEASVFSTTGTTATQALDISGFADADATTLANFVAGVVEALQAKGVL